MSHRAIHSAVGAYYAQRLEMFGATSRGVDWNSPESQHLRFEQLLRCIDAPAAEPLRILDYGCGYGALAPVLEQRWPRVDYTGYDIASEMTAAAALLHPQRRFVTAIPDGERFDYVIASGIFSVKLDVDIPAWEAYIRDTVDVMAALARKAIAFNMLTSYSDADRMRPDLYYANPQAWFTHCCSEISRRVALLHDYPLYEFVLIVRQ